MGRLFLMSMGLTMLVGCGDQSSHSAAMVSGAVTLNGEPFTGVAVQLYNPEFGGGTFNLTEDGTFASGDPLPVGEYMVSFVRPGPTPGSSPAEESWPTDKSGEVPMKYRSSAKSGLFARLAMGEENHFVFDMQGEPSSDEREGPTPFQPLSEFTN